MWGDLLLSLVVAFGANVPLALIELRKSKLFTKQTQINNEIKRKRKRKPKQTSKKNKTKKTPKQNKTKQNKSNKLDADKSEVNHLGSSTNVSTDIYVRVYQYTFLLENFSPLHLLDSFLRFSDLVMRALFSVKSNK